MDSRGILRLEMGFYIGIVFGALLKSLYRRHVIFAYQEFGLQLTGGMVVVWAW